jgi:hypothetical protein
MKTIEFLELREDFFELESWLKLACGKVLYALSLMAK